MLSGFTDALREFLYCLAQLRSFSAELCVHAIGGAEVNAHLAYLVERNVFVIPLDRTRSRYRLHGLFRDHLRHEAERLLSPKRRQDVLIRAARWCEKSGDWRDAVDYALASGSASATGQILEQIAPAFVRDRGDVPQYLRWLEALHAQGRQAGPEAEYWFVWALAFHRRYDDARRHSTALANRVQRKAPAAQDRDLQRRIAILRTSIDSLTDHLDDAHRGARDWLAGAESSDDAFNRTAAHCIVSGYHANGFAFVEARRAISSAGSRTSTGSAIVGGGVGGGVSGNSFTAWACLVLGGASLQPVKTTRASALASSCTSLSTSLGCSGASSSASSVRSTSRSSGASRSSSTA